MDDGNRPNHVWNGEIEISRIVFDDSTAMGAQTFVSAGGREYSLSAPRTSWLSKVSLLDILCVLVIGVSFIIGVILVFMSDDETIGGNIIIAVLGFVTGRGVSWGETKIGASRSLKA